mgnify:FL=1|jgi:hypothetical protein
MLSAQFNLGFRESGESLVTFEKDGTDLRLLGVGGFNAPQFSEIDLDDDGVMDLFVFDRYQDTWRTFLYNSTSSRYDYAPHYEQFFPREMQDFAILKDYNCDGKKDLFTFYQASFRVFKNVGSDSPEFIQVIDKLQSDYGSVTTNAFVLGGDVPAIVDEDADGDLDILTFGSVNSENTIEFHRNLSMELYGTCDSLEFEVVTQCWGNVEEPSNSSTLQVTSCKGIIPPKGLRHPGSSILLVDSDGDGDQDLVVGDIQTNSVVHAINVGDVNSASIDVNQQTNDFPNATDPIEMPFLVSGYEIDTDHDGNLDLIMSVNNTIDSSTNHGHTWLYNNNSSTAPDYVLETKEFLLEEMLDLGAMTAPVSMDYNGDGDQDLLIAVDYSRNPNGGLKSRIHYFEQQNDGSFLYEDGDIGGLSAFGFEAVVPGLGDIDGDGDLDMLIGTLDGTLHLLRNNSVGGQSNFTLAIPQYMSITSIGSNATPEFADINDDGILDLVVGDRTGTVAYFENGGTTSSASFPSVPTIANLGGIDVNPICCDGFSTPRFVRNDAFGEGRYLFVGSNELSVEIFEIPTDLSGEFTRLDSLFFNVSKISPLVMDIDSDGIYELLLGTGEGGLKIFSREKNYVVDAEELEDDKFRLFPNPSGTQIQIDFQSSAVRELMVFDVQGRLIEQKVITSASHNLTVATYSVGLYVLKVITNSESRTARIVVQR